jgi:hypothetical protein
MKPSQLQMLLDDPDWRVRYEVASRAEQNHLRRLASDKDELVREVVRQRLGPAAGDVSQLLVQKPAPRMF